MTPAKVVKQAVEHTRRLASTYPWVKTPLIVSAPMRVFAGPELAVAVSRAGGLGFIGPGVKPESALIDLDRAVEILSSSEKIKGSGDTNLLPIGIGFMLWNGDVKAAASAVEKHKPSAAWLFAPQDGQADVDTWTARLREASPDTKIWLQVGSLLEVLAAVKSSHPPDVLVLQGTEAGGHGRAKDGIGIITLLPEVADAIESSNIPLVAAGGIADGRGCAAALGLGAAGVVMGTRFLASTETRIPKGYQDEVIRATDGATSTVRTQLYNHLRGMFGWPESFSPRGLSNLTWEDHKAGVPFEELKKRHDEADKTGDAAWGPSGRVATYAGANVGLVKRVDDAGTIVTEVRSEAVDIVQALLGAFSSK